MYADLILPLNLPQTLTYGIPLGMQPYIQRGMRVEVGLGKNKQYAGIVVQIHNHKPDAYQVKPIRSLIDKQPIVDSVQLAFWEWVASYYMASPGEVMNAALPAHLKLMSETRIQWIAAFLPQSPNEVVTRVITQLQTHSVLTLSEISQITGAKDLPFVLQELLDNEWVSVNDHLEDPYKPKIEKIIELHPNYAQEGQLKSLFSMLERAPKQLALLMCYIEIHQKKKYVRQAELLERADATSAQLKMMTEKGILVVKEVAVDRLSGYVIDTPAAISFTVAQKTAYDRLSHLLLTKNVVLLHGVTGSGKTLLYIEKIKEYINNGYQALFLLPEIALTQHLVQRLHVHFGESMGVYHSKFSNHERVEIWENVRKGKYKVVVGARSAIWLPYPKLGVIIADEEHDVSYKQKDPAPRFHARDAAIYLATLHGAKVILGSATPSIESLQHVKAGKYAYCSLSERYNNVPLPAIRILDARTIGTVKSHRRQIITPELEQAIAQALQHKKQVVLFQNKRGYTPIQLCTTCGKVVQCKNCSVALSYHKATDKLHCHFCGLKINIANYCASCGSNTLISKSYGTEKIEEEVQFLFPKARIARMDTDSMKGKNSAEELLYKLLNHQIDILVGTQMVVKGLDLPNVSVVGILSADSLWSYPDFRVNERAYQLMEQVSGRAGRTDGNGTVWIQAFNTQHETLQWVLYHNLNAYYTQEITYRSHLGYPPFCRLIKIVFKHSQEQKAVNAAQEFTKKIATTQGIVIVGPAPAPVARVNNYYLYELWVKCPVNAKQLAEIKAVLVKERTKLLGERGNSNVQIIFDADPV